MGSKRDIKVYIFPALVFLAFLFSIIGYRQDTNEHYSLLQIIYTVITSFVLENIPPKEVDINPWLLTARYLAAILVGFGIYSLLYKYISSFITRIRIRNNYRHHVIVFSVKMVGTDFVSGLVAGKYKVIVIEQKADDNDSDKFGKKGVIVFREEHFDTKLFDNLMLSHARTVVVAFDDDSVNIDLTLKIIRHLRARQHRRAVRILTHIRDMNNLEVMQDYTDISNADENFEFEVFNINNAAAKILYDHFPPHKWFNFDNREEEKSIAVIGYNRASEDFIIENMILSHYHDGGNIRLYLVDKDADHHLNQFMYHYPFCREFIEIIPVKLLNDKFFANFNWSKELIEKLSKVKAAYFFGNEGSALINSAARFRQFLYGQTLNYLHVPIVICFPEDTGIMKLLDAERESSEKLSHVFKNKLNISFLNMVSDTCTTSRLMDESEYIDMLSRIINYYYSLKYEFESVLKDKYKLSSTDKLIDTIEKQLQAIGANVESVAEHDVENAVLDHLSAATGAAASSLKKTFGIKPWWEHLTYHKKDANRYAARHLAVKIQIMKSIDCLPLTRENILNSFSVIAPVEHKRWSAEKMVLNYRFGSLPRDKAAKNNVKELLKIHDQLIPYEKLSESEKEKDLNIFLLMPLLNSLKVETKP